jgi:hypothetical protein
MVVTNADEAAVGLDFPALDVTGDAVITPGGQRGKNAADGHHRDSDDERCVRATRVDAQLAAFAGEIAHPHIEFRHDEAEADDGDARPHPGEEGSFVGQVFGGLFVVVQLGGGLLGFHRVALA